MTDLLLDILLKVITSIVSIIIQYKFRIIQRLKRLWAFINNDSVKLGLFLTLKSDKDARNIGMSIGDSWKDDNKSVRIITDSKNSYSLSNEDYTIDIHRLPDKEIGIKTSNIEIPIRRVEDKFSEIMGLFDRTKDINIEKLSLSALFPFKFEFVEIKTSSNISVENYDIKLKNDKWKSEMSLNLRNRKQEIMINSDTRTEMHKIIKKLFKP